MMLTQNNMNALKAKDLNPHLFVAEYNAFEDPVIREFVNEWQEFFKVAACTVFIYIAYGFGLSLFGWTVTVLWPFFQEWIEIICMVSSISVTVMFLKLIHDETEQVDTYIGKLKAELADKDAIIAELELKLANIDSDSDSDYDPDVDEY
jgi:hypothetical protein